ncbi:MAG: glutamyl-tRNA reductase, partial [Gemmatimonadaceae bacterium]
MHASALDDALTRLRTRVGEGFVLSTCHRTEVYAVVGHAESGARLLSDFLAECGGMDAAELAPHVLVRAHDDAVAHLFGVASGIHSMVTGEDQILAQLKAALARARLMRTLGPTLHRLGAAALAVGKRVRTDTAINRHALSVVSVALDDSVACLKSLAGRRVVVIGAGHTAELVLKHLSHLRGGGRARCIVVNRGITR